MLSCNFILAITEGFCNLQSYELHASISYLAQKHKAEDLMKHLINCISRSNARCKNSVHVLHFYYVAATELMQLISAISSNEKKCGNFQISIALKCTLCLGKKLNKWDSHSCRRKYGLWHSALKQGHQGQINDFLREIDMLQSFILQQR